MLFTKLHPGTVVTVDPGNGDTQKVIVQSQAGVGPDVFDYWGQGNFVAFVKSGIAFDYGQERIDADIAGRASSVRQRLRQGNPPDDGGKRHKRRATPLALCGRSEVFGEGDSARRGQGVS